MGFFNLGDALDEVKNSYGFKDVAIAGLKLVGKAAVNTVEVTGDVALKAVEAIPYVALYGAESIAKRSGEMLGNSNLTDEQREKAEGIYYRACDTMYAAGKTIAEEEDRKKKEREAREAMAKTPEED